MTRIEKISPEEYLDSYIDIYSALNVKEEDRLRPREKQFFIYCIIANQSVKSIDSSLAIKYVMSKMHFRTSQDFYNYKSKLKTKNWILLSTTGEAILSDDFTFTNGIPQKFIFNVELEYKS